MLNHPPTIVSTCTAVPDHTITSDTVKEYAGQIYRDFPRHVEMIRSIVDNGRIEKRHLVQPLDYTVDPRPLSQISGEYRRHAVTLAEQAARGALEQAGLEPQQVDYLITVSCTGLMIPSMDAHLVNRMGFRSDVRRLPITELGCAAGAASISLASNLLRVRPNTTALLISVELASLTFQRDDTSLPHLVSCTLFGDGAAAAVLTNRPAPGIAVHGSACHFFPNSLQAMGFDLRESGLHIILDKDVPLLVKTNIRQLVCKFLDEHAQDRSGLSFFVLHPGGHKLLAYVQEELGLTEDEVEPARHVLAQYGNLSSATVFFVLDHVVRQNRRRSGERGLMTAFGPGFTAEMLLLEWK